MEIILTEKQDMFAFDATLCVSSSIIQVVILNIGFWERNRELYISREAKF